MFKFSSSSLYGLLLCSFACCALICSSTAVEMREKPDFSCFVDPASLLGLRLKYQEDHLDRLTDLESYAKDGSLGTALANDVRARIALRGALYYYILANNGDMPPDVFYDDALVQAFADDRYRSIDLYLLLIARRFPEYGDWLRIKLAERYGYPGQEIWDGGELHWVSAATLGGVDYAGDLEPEFIKERLPGLAEKMSALVRKRMQDGKLLLRDAESLAAILHLAYSDCSAARYEEMYELIEHMSSTFDIRYLILELEFVFGITPANG